MFIKILYITTLLLSLTFLQGSNQTDASMGLKHNIKAGPGGSTDIEVIYTNATSDVSSLSMLVDIPTSFEIINFSEGIILLPGNTGSAERQSTVNYSRICGDAQQLKFFLSVPNKNPARINSGQVLFSIKVKDRNTGNSAPIKVFSTPGVALVSSPSQVLVPAQVYEIPISSEADVSTLTFISNFANFQGTLLPSLDVNKDGVFTLADLVLFLQNK